MGKHLSQNSLRYRFDAHAEEVHGGNGLLVAGNSVNCLHLEICVLIIKDLLKYVFKIKHTKAKKYSVEDPLPPRSLMTAVRAAKIANISLCSVESERKPFRSLFKRINIINLYCFKYIFNIN